MNFIVTARKWRPQLFNEVVGQQHITSTLKNAIKSGRIAHAYLFAGPRGVGKTTTARILAKTINCLSPIDFEPCNKCEMCVTVQNGQSMDFIEIDGASNRGIDEIRTLRDSVKYAPTQGKYKVYIIDEVHMLTKESFNAFLKTLEEPPPHVVFIFATTDVHKVPLTIISRCQRYDFRRIELDTIKSLLTKIAAEEKISIDDKTLTTIAKRADGALRDAESLFDQAVSFCGNTVDFDTVSKMFNLINDEVYFAISDAILKKNFSEAFEISQTLYNNGWNYIDFLNGLIEHFRNIMTVVITGKTNLIESAEIFKTRYLEYIKEFSEGDLLRALAFLNKTQQELKFSTNHRIKIEIALCHLIGLEKTSTISELLSNIGNLPTETNSVSTAGSAGKQNSYSSKEKTTFTYKTIDNTTSTGNIKVSDVKESISTATASRETSFSLNTILSNWDNFVEEVNGEKKLTVGPAVSIIKPQNLDGNKLFVYLPDDDSQKVIEQNSDYLSRKTEEFFGKKLIFQFTVTPLTTDYVTTGVELNQVKKETKKKTDENPFVNAIITELGGEEIT